MCVVVPSLINLGLITGEKSASHHWERLDGSPSSYTHPIDGTEKPLKKQLARIPKRQYSELSDSLSLHGTATLLILTTPCTWKVSEVGLFDPSVPAEGDMTDASFIPGFGLVSDVSVAVNDLITSFDNLVKNHKHLHHLARTRVPIATRDLYTCEVAHD
ncbi:hypothetical protein PENFLA_c009G08610 [Penicillium flavigenum]|uniref:Uncharacterized protein n=1 Tax=Penicillium flavigenum TaxID=254877 RepID=A0A1V6TFG6_9EURO|nr:hypothetical protein PENFLA_c009G08610 [Penicillium flavigenum]